MKQTVFHNSIQKLLWVRPDAVGDATLSASMLPHLKERFEQSEIHVICRSPLYDFYAECPYVDKVIAFDLDRLLNHEVYRRQLVELLARNKYDLCLDSSRSPTYVTEFLIDNSGAEVKINHKAALGETPPISELKNHRNFINKIGCEVKKDLKPLVWISHHVEASVDKTFKENNLEPSLTIVLAAGVGAPILPIYSQKNRWIRRYDHYGEALNSLCREKKQTLVLVGTEADLPSIHKNLRNFSGRVVNLAGKTSILEMAAIIKRATLLVGADSGAAHLACAVGTPNAIILGGGEYGRFFPYSPLTYVATLPLDCFGCLWDCKFDNPYCITNVSPKTLEEAIRGALEASDKKTYCQQSL